MMQRLRSICMVLAFVVGGLFHDSIDDYQYLLPIGIGVMLSITFVSLDARRLKPKRMHLWLMLALQLFALCFWGMARLLGYPILAEGVYYCAAAPIASASPVIINLLRGDVEFSTTAMVLSQVVFALVTPFVLPFVVHDSSLSYFEISYQVAEQIASILLAPALFSIVLRWIYPPSIHWGVKLRDFSLGVWIFNLTLISAVGTTRVLTMGYTRTDLLPMVLGAAVVCLAGFVVGYWLGYPHLKRECSQALGQKNTVLTLFIAGQSFATPLAYVAPVFYVFFHNVANAIQITLSNREKKGHQSALSSEK